MTADPVIHIVEDDPAMRDALSLLLQTAGFPVRSFGCAEELLSDISPGQPVCLLTDLRLPGMDGLQLYHKLISTGATPVTIVITGHGDIPMAVAALKDGVLDFVEKPFDPMLLVESVSSAARRYVEASRRRAIDIDIENRLETLTSREQEVLALVVEGHPNKIIAATLGISTRTAEHHRARIMEKVGVRTLSQLVKLALRIAD